MADADLDALLADLGSGSRSSTRVGGTAPGAADAGNRDSSQVNLNDLDDLMASLSTDPAPAPAKKATPAPTPQPAASQAEDSLDALMSELSSPSSQPAPAAQPTRSAPPPEPRQSNPPVPSGNASGGGGGGDELSDLLASLGGPGGGGGAAPAPKPKAAPAPQPARTQSRPAPAPAPAKAAGGGGGTDDLDDLMASLSAEPAKPAPRAQPAPQAQPKPAAGGGGGADELDALLGNLNATATSTVNAVGGGGGGGYGGGGGGGGGNVRGQCITCGQPIVGEMMQALGKQFHPEHFCCGSCSEPLGTANFYEVEGEPNCERCYQKMFCPQCAHCDKPVMDRCVTALGKKWHSSCFVCTKCMSPFPDGNFFEKNGMPYDEKCFYDTFAPKCSTCQKGIQGDCINALGNQYHSDCFVCAYCQKSFGNGMFYEKGGKPYCETHYHMETGSVCAACSNPITGSVVNAMGKKFHPDHFVCSFCLGKLSGSSYSEQEGKAYCKDCHNKLFA